MNLRRLPMQVGNYGTSSMTPVSPSSLSVGSFEWGYVAEAGQPSTADLIASQSQDYIDERLQEFQATIAQLQCKSIIRHPFQSISLYHYLTNYY